MSYEYLRRLEADFERDKHIKWWRRMLWVFRLLFLAALVAAIGALDLAGVVLILVLMITNEYCANKWVR